MIENRARAMLSLYLIYVVYQRANSGIQRISLYQRFTDDLSQRAGSRGVYSTNVIAREKVVYNLYIIYSIVARALGLADA